MVCKAMLFLFRFLQRPPIRRLATQYDIIRVDSCSGQPCKQRSARSHAGLGVSGRRDGAERRPGAARARHREPRSRGRRRQQHRHRDVAGRAPQTVYSTHAYGPNVLALLCTLTWARKMCTAMHAEAVEITLASCDLCKLHAACRRLQPLLQASRSYSAPLDMTRKGSAPLTIVTSGSHIGSGALPIPLTRS